MMPRIGCKAILLLVVLAACAPPDVADFTGKARFADYPESLIGALQAACARPAQSFSRPERNTIECREYLPPEATAAVILTYDGTPEDLPELVIRFETRADAPGYVVENQVFLNVPQKRGAALRVPQSDAGLNRMLDALYRRAGGIPE